MTVNPGEKVRIRSALIMKQRRATKLTRAQKIFLSKNTWLKPENWWLIEENSTALVIQHKKSGKVKTVKK